MPPAITSKQNPRIKQAAALRNRGEREARRQTLVYGARETQRALAAGAELVEAFVCAELLRGTDAESTAEQLLGDSRTYTVTPEVFERLAYGDRLDGVIAVVRTTARGLADLTLPADPLIAVIEGSEKPGNLGAILRSADGAGVDAIIVADAVIDLFNPNTIRASVGAVFKPNIAVATAAETCTWLHRHAIRGYALRPDARESYSDANLTGGVAVLVGNEAHGLSAAWNEASITPLSLPMLGLADSLNASVAAAVLFYEARRQRK